MNSNKILLEIYVPSVEREYDIFVPVNNKIGTLKKWLEKGISDLTDNDYKIFETTNLYNKETGSLYDVNLKIIDSDLENGSRLILV